MQNNENKIKIFSVRDRLAVDLFTELQTALCAPHLDEERLVQRMLWLLNQKPYSSELLFQDYTQASQRVVAEQSFLYLTELWILYRLKPAASLKGKPGNMHRLMEAFFHQAQITWAQTVVIQRQKLFEQHIEDFLLIMAQKLKELCQKVESSLCAVALGQRHDFGTLCLQAQNSCVAVPEQLSLFEMLRLLPLPLHHFASDFRVLKLLARVIDSLNERYMLLRACGLNPEQWLHREDLSINNLRDIVRLRKAAVEYANAEAREHDLHLYRQCFNILQDNDKKFAGYATFEAFYQSEAGEIFLNAFAFIESHHVFEEMVEPTTKIEEEPQNPIIWIEKLIAAYPQPFEKDPLMLYFFRKSLAGGIPLCGDERVAGLLEHTECQALVTNDPQYAKLDRAQLAKKIYANAKKIIHAGRKKCTLQIH